MDAVELIKEHLDVYKILEYYNFESIHEDGDKLRSACAIHGGKNPSSFVIDKETGLWYCHSGCGGGDIYTLIQIKEKLDFKNSVIWAANFFGVNIGGAKIVRHETFLKKELKSWLSAMKKSTKKECKEYNNEIISKKLTKLRSFTQETIDFFDVSYAEKVNLKRKDGSDYTVYKKLLFPIMFNGKQVGINFRRIKSTDNPKWLLQPSELVAGNILYNFDNVQDATEIVVCEGIYDVMAYHEIGVSAVACFGAHMTEQQYKLLLNMGVDITLSFDSDSAGEKGMQKVVDMFKNKVTLRRVYLPEGEDPESISREQLKKIWEERRRV